MNNFVEILNRFKKGRVGFSLDVCDESIEYSRWHLQIGNRLKTMF